MRIPSRWAFLAATTILSRTAAANDGSVAFNFDDMLPFSVRTDDGKTTSIFSISQGGVTGPLTINWVAGSDFLLSKFELFFLDLDKNEPTSLGSKVVEPPSPSPSTVTVTTTTRGRLPDSGDRTSIPAPTDFPFPQFSPEKRAVMDQMQPVDFSVSPDEKRLQIKNMTSLLQFKGMPLYFRVNWDRSGDISFSFSRAFTVVQSLESFPPWTQDYFVDSKPIQADGFNVEPTRTGALPTDFRNSPSPSSKEGLPTGAIAGIAVGCALVGIAVIGFLIWFFLRRRHQARDDDALDAYRNGRTRTDELMAEKEANGGMDASPHSPYSDDGGHHDSGSLRHVGTGGAGTAATAALVGGSHKKGLSQTQSLHDAPRSYSPYSDHQASMAARSPSTHAASVVAPSTAPPGAPDSPTPSRAVPRGTLSTPYAHLVEEGMTEEEIRRLEDEERALDAAIEQSARRT